MTVILRHSDNNVPNYGLFSSVADATHKGLSLLFSIGEANTPAENFMSLGTP